MAYATLAHVNARCPTRSFTASSVPNATQVVMFLEGAAATIDSTLTAAGYQLPVPAAATSALKLLERVNAIGAWAEVEAAAQKSEDQERADKMFMAELAKLDPRQKGPTIELDGVSRQVGETYARGKTFEEAGLASTPQPFFTLDMEL